MMNPSRLRFTLLLRCFLASLLTALEFLIALHPRSLARAMWRDFHGYPPARSRTRRHA